MRTMKRQAAGITALLMMALVLSVLFAPAAMAATHPIPGWGGNHEVNTDDSGDTIIDFSGIGVATVTSVISNPGLGVSVSPQNSATATIKITATANYVGVISVTYDHDIVGGGVATNVTSKFTIRPTGARRDPIKSMDSSGRAMFSLADLVKVTGNGTYKMRVSVTAAPSNGVIFGRTSSTASWEDINGNPATTEYTDIMYGSNDKTSADAASLNIILVQTASQAASMPISVNIGIKASGTLAANPVTISTDVGASSFSVFSLGRDVTGYTSAATIRILSPGPSRGTLTNSPDMIYGFKYAIGNIGSFVYTPPSDWTGTVTFSYVVEDTTLPDDSTATVTINIRPKANNDSYIVPMNGTFEPKNTAYLLSNDKYYGGVTLAIATNPSHGSITDFNTTTGYFKYTPQLGYNGTDTFTYTIKDGSGLTSAAAAVSLKVGGSNYDAVVDSGGLSVSVANGLLASYPSGYSVRSNASTSSYFTLYSNGSFTFIPPAGQSGLFTLQYDLVDPSGVATAQSVTVAVRPRGVNTTYDTANNITFSLSSADARKVNLGSNIRATVTGNPTYGTLNMLTDGTFTYVPNAGFVGTDTFRYRLTDTVANLDSDEVTVTIRVASASLLPDDQTIPTLPPTGTSEAIDWALICLGAAVVLGGLYAIYVARKRMTKKE